MAQSSTTRRYRSAVTPANIATSAMRCVMKFSNATDCHRDRIPGLADAMLRIPPEEVRFLTEEEAKAYGLTMMDPVYGECASDTAKSRLTAQVVLQSASFA